MIMDKTIKQMSQELGINKLRIYRFIDKQNIKSSKTIKGTKLYDISAQELIYMNFNLDNKNYIFHKDNIDKDNIDKDNIVINEKNKIIKLIENELSEKNKQLNNLQKMLDQQQQLSLQDKQIISKQNEKLKALIDSKSKDNTNDKKSEKRNDHWWHFWN